MVLSRAIIIIYCLLAGWVAGDGLHDLTLKLFSEYINYSENIALGNTPFIKNNSYISFSGDNFLELKKADNNKTQLSENDLINFVFFSADDLNYSYRGYLNTVIIIKENTGKNSKLAWKTKSYRNRYGEINKNSFITKTESFYTHEINSFNHPFNITFITENTLNKTITLRC